MFQRITDTEFQTYKEFIRNEFGISLSDTKKALVETRLNKLLKAYKLESFNELYLRLKKDNSLETLSDVIDRISTNHTYFYREKEHYDFLKINFNELMQIQANDVQKEFRIWVAGCSYGDEPYTFSIYMDDLAKSLNKVLNLKILATDISKEALDFALSGKYSLDRIEKLPRYLQLNAFDKVDDEKYSVKKKFRDKVLYRRLNLMRDSFPFQKKFHLISCRNVMIYFNEETKSELLRKFYDHLSDDGYLFIGHSESISKSNTFFKAIAPSIFIKQ